MLSFKQGVKLAQLQPQIVLGLLAVHSIFEGFGYELVITSVSDGKHKTNSLHYAGSAVDIRTRDLQASDVPLIISNIKSALGSNFDVIFEVTHIHIEYDPKY